MVKRLDLNNAEVKRGRVELPRKNIRFYNWAGSHCPPTFFGWVQDSQGAKHFPANGILYLQGGIHQELKTSGLHPRRYGTWMNFPEAELGEKFLSILNLGFQTLKRASAMCDGVSATKYRPIKLPLWLPSFPPDTIAPACPIRRPGGAVIRR